MSNIMIEKKSEGRSVHSPFNRSVFEVLEHIEYRLCEKGEDLEAVYRLRYDSYRAAGMIKDDAAKMVTDKYDDMPNSYCFGVFYREHLVSTIRGHLINRDHPDAPSCGVFGDIVAPRVEAGETFFDPSRFAADAEWARTLRVLPYITLRLAVLGCKYFDTDYCLIAIKEDHSPFYYRTFKAEAATGPRTYPGLTMPVHLLQMNTKDHLDQVIERFPFFRYTALEQRMLFKRPPNGEMPPLTILPTAKYIKQAA